MIYKILNRYNLPTLFSILLLNIITIFYFPYYIYNYGIVWQEPVLFFIGWISSGMGITIGYHRYFSHKTFKTYSFIEWVLMLCGTMGLQNKIINWCSDHRRHHKKLDTPQDPYSITEGFLHAHIGWVVKKSDESIGGISDLTKKPAVKFQTKYYWPLAMILCFIIPTIIGLLFNRPIGGLLWGGIVRVVLVHHFTFFINSFCHFIGKKNYELHTSARDSWFMAFLTFGEGYHNYHHKFQWDYRNGIKWYNFDPSKWIIKFLSYFKLTYNLRMVERPAIFKAQIETVNNQIIKISKNINLDKLSNKNIKDITSKALRNIESWELLENRYKRLKNISKKKYRNVFYKKRIKYFELQLKNSLNSLMIILLNLKNIV
tara:strand:- start:92 stop:1210 length:1119 start_codon:yes stop_codon:yes gene_type:complete